MFLHGNGALWTAALADEQPPPDLFLVEQHDLLVFQLDDAVPTVPTLAQPRAAESTLETLAVVLLAHASRTVTPTCVDHLRLPLAELRLERERVFEHSFSGGVFYLDAMLFVVVALVAGTAAAELPGREARAVELQTVCSVAPAADWCLRQRDLRLRPP